MINKKSILESAGWHTYYNPNYWVNPRVISDKKIQDYTDYGMTLEDAYIFHINNLYGIKPLYGIPLLNTLQHIKNKGIIKA